VENPSTILIPNHFANSKSMQMSFAPFDILDIDRKTEKARRILRWAFFL
jgi:hypothetical protein